MDILQTSGMQHGPSTEILQLSRAKLLAHPVYQQLKSMEDISIFMQTHVFAVWDFMSLLKRLQNQLTCVSVPWQPSPYPEAARFINEIVLTEESDVDPLGGHISHFELYLRAMAEVGASSADLQHLLHQLNSKIPFAQALDRSSLPPHIKQFLHFTFQMVEHGKPHQVAAVFTYGREDIIPEMFFRVLSRMNQAQQTTYPSFRYYLQRHIDVDGDEHGPMAEKMLHSLCANEAILWNEVVQAATDAINSRIALWDGVLAQLRTARGRDSAHRLMPS